MLQLARRPEEQGSTLGRVWSCPPGETRDWHGGNYCFGRTSLEVSLSFLYSSLLRRTHPRRTCLLLPSLRRVSKGTRLSCFLCQGDRHPAPGSTFQDTRSCITTLQDTRSCIATLHDTRFCNAGLQGTRFCHASHHLRRFFIAIFQEPRFTPAGFPRLKSLLYQPPRLKGLWGV